MNLRARFDQLTKRAENRRRLDTWSSAIHGLGTETYDKRLGATFVADTVSRTEAIELWRGDDLAHRIIEGRPDDMLRQGFRFVATGDEVDDLQEDIHSDWSDLGLRDAFCRAKKYERAFGGAAILLGIDDGRPPDTPVNEDTVRGLNWLTVLEPYELQPAYYYDDPFAPKYGQPELYEMTPLVRGYARKASTPPTNVLIHESRLLIFPGIQTTRQGVAGLNGWGDSVLTRVRSVLRDFQMSWAGVGVLMLDFSQAVFKMQGLAELIAADEDETIRTRMRALELGRSIARCAFIDAGDNESPGDSFERVQTPVQGLPELLDRLAERVAAAADMPFTKLFGRAPAGLNATGESDMRNYYDTVRSAQENELEPHISRITWLLVRARNDKAENWSIQFNPLWQPTGKEIAEERKLVAEADKIYVEAGIVAPDEVAQSRWSGDRYSPDMKIDFANREAYDQMQQAEADLEIKKAEALANKPANNDGNGQDNGQKSPTEAG